MTYELWAGNVRLGQSTFDFPQLSRVTFAGEFAASPDQFEAVERMALRVECISAWMNRDLRNDTGDYLIVENYRNSRLFTTISELVAQQFDPSLQLRTADGTVIPTKHLVIRDGERPTLYPDLVAEAISAGDADIPLDADDVPPPFNGSAEGRELFRTLQEEAEEEARDNAWRGDTGADDFDEEAWKAEFEDIERAPRERFQLYVMIEREGDIPADLNWLA